MNKDNPTLITEGLTPRTVVYKHESHKLHQAFTVADDQVILKGMPVALTEAGTITPFYSGSTGTYLGIAVTDNINPAYKAVNSFPVEVTVMVEAFALLNCVSAGAMGAGYVIPTGNTVNNRFVEVDAEEDGSPFLCITPADEAGEIVQVLVK